MTIIRAIWISLIILLLAGNIIQQTFKLIPNHPVSFAGMKFAGLNEFLKTETRVGYLTDKPMIEDRNLAEFEQAQLMLAPVILELNNPRFKYVIVNCSNDSQALSALKAVEAKPIKRNNFGVILAVRDSSPGGIPF